MDNLVESKNFVEDLGQFLIGFLKPQRYSFYFQNQELYFEDVFSAYGAMPMFLCDKQELIETYNQAINNIDKLEYPLKAQVMLTPQMGTFFGCSVQVQHNLVTNELLVNDNDYYNGLIELVAKTILSQKHLLVDGKKIHLDMLYNHYQNCLMNILKRSGHKI